MGNQWLYTVVVHRKDLKLVIWKQEHAEINRLLFFLLVLHLKFQILHKK